MSANLTTYCLQELTDYAEFERLCHEIMAKVGYTAIEPLGGFKDKGRDAIHVSSTGGTTIFAYSVRDDWRAKLSEDAEKIRHHGHSCDHLVFITTSAITAGERDEAIETVQKQYGWSLELYSLQRLNNLLDAQFPYIRVHFPQIFPPEFLKIQDQARQAEQRDYLFISYAPEDFALASWLARKLTAEGYLVWCDRLAFDGAEEYPDDIDDAIQRRIYRVIALYSGKSLEDPDVLRHRAIALGVNKQLAHFIIPLRTEPLLTDKLDKVTRGLIFLPFETDWAEGLRLLLEKLVAAKCPRLLPHGKSVAAGAFLEKDVLSDVSETLVSNYFPVESLPENVQRYSLQRLIPPEDLETVKLKWAFRSVSDHLLISFQHPPQELIDSYGLKEISEGPWRGIEKVEGISARNLISELIRKALGVRCIQKGLLYCRETHVYYFPFGSVPGNKVKYLWPSGKTAHVNTVGERKFSPTERYRYYLAPDFYVIQEPDDRFAVLIRIRIRITDTEGQTLPSKRANSRRKDLCGDWWNGEFLSRMLGVCQYLADGEQIVIGEYPSEKIIVSATPLTLTAPRGIDESKLDTDVYQRRDIVFRADDETGDTQGEETDGIQEEKADG